MRYEHTYYGPEDSFERQASIVIALYPETEEEFEQLRTIRENYNSCSVQHTLSEDQFSCVGESEKDFRVEFSISP